MQLLQALIRITRLRTFGHMFPATDHTTAAIYGLYKYIYKPSNSSPEMVI